MMNLLLRLVFWCCALAHLLFRWPSGNKAVQPGHQNTVFYQKPLRLVQRARDYSKFRPKYTKNLHLAAKNDTSHQQSKQSVLAMLSILPAYCQTCAAYPPKFFR